MSPGGGGVDIDIVVSPASALKIFKDLERAAADMAKGVEGSVGRWESAVDHAAKFSTTVVNRTQQAQERYIRSLEATAAAAGKTGTEKLIAQRDAIIKRFGDEEKAVLRVRAAYDKLIEAQKKQDGGSGGHGGSPAMLALRGVRDFAEGRTAYAEMMIGRSLTSLSGVPLLLGSMAAAFVGVEVAGYKAAKAVAEYGMHVHDMQIKTGMSAIEVQKLDFAAKLTGNDISVMDRVMRGLTQALTDNSSQGLKAREVLRGMGVDVLALQTGEMRTVDLLKQVGDALEHNPNLWQRNKDAIDLFKRAGIQTLPMLVEWNTAMQKAQAVNFPNDAAVAHFKQINDELVLAGTKWEVFKTKLEAQLAKPFIITLDFVSKPGFMLGLMGGWGAGVSARGQSASTDGYGVGTNVPYDVEHPEYGSFAGESSGGAFESRSEHELAQWKARQRRGVIEAGQAYSQSLIGRDLEATEREANRLKQAYDATVAPGSTSTRGEIRTARDASNQIHNVVERLRKEETDQRSNAEAIRKLTIDTAERLAHPFGLLPAESRLKSILELPGIRPGQTAEARRLLAPEIADEQRERTEKFQREIQQQSIMESRELTRIKLSAKSDLGVMELGKDGVTASQVEASLRAQYSSRLSTSHQEYLDTITDLRNTPIRSGDIVGFQGRAKSMLDAEKVERVSNARSALDLDQQISALHTRDQEQTTRFHEVMSKIQEDEKVNEIRHIADLKVKYAEMGFRGDNPAAGIQAAQRIRQQEAQSIYDQEETRIRLHEKLYQADESHERNLRRLHDEDGKAREEAQVKLFEMQQRQLDEIKGKTKSLLETLFTHPSQFATQLGTTLRGAILSPIIGGASERIAQGLHGTIYGAQGTSGIAGALQSIFGGRGSGTYSPQSATPPSAAPPPTYDFQGFPHGPLIGGLSNFPRIPGSEFGGLTGGISTSATTSDLAMGGTPPFLAGGGTNAGGGGFNLGGLFGGGGGGTGGGWRGILSNLKGNLGGLTRADAGGIPGVDGQPGTDLGNSGKITGVNGLLGQALIAGGFALASHGLLGNSRGTASGTVQGAFGGAMLGFSLGGPLGAAIGGVAGLGIGIGEMIAGVETPRHQAIRLVKQTYHIDISNGMADQIVALANQSYGGTVSIAVRSPEVRQMLGLYAAGTGQAGSFPQSASTPHGSSLVESGGSLFQNKTYSYGNPYTYSSSLPVYGGGGGGTYPSPGGGLTQIALSISGAGVAPFMRNEFVTPDFVSSQQSAAWNGSVNRMQNSLTLQEPGSSVG